jgi:hypothetical protein
MGLTVWSMAACSLSFPRHETASAIAMTTAPNATNPKTVRDIALPTVRPPSPLASQPAFA